MLSPEEYEVLVAEGTCVRCLEAQVLKGTFGAGVDAYEVHVCPACMGEYEAQVFVPAK